MPALENLLNTLENSLYTSLVSPKNELKEKTMDEAPDEELQKIRAEIERLQLQK